MPKGCVYFSGKQIGICFSCLPKKPNQSVSGSEDGAEGKTRDKIWEPHSLLFLPIPQERCIICSSALLSYTLFSPTSPHPSSPLELLPWLPGMVAKSLHGRVGVGCTATNITMVNQGKPGIGLGGGIMQATTPTQNRMSLKGDHLEHHSRWGLNELGTVVAVTESATLGNGGQLYHFSC